MKATSQGNPPWEYGGAGSGGIPSDWKSVVADGPKEVVVTLAAPANPEWFVHNALSQIWPIPEAVWNRYPNSMTQELRFIAGVSNTPTAPEYRVVDGPWKFLKMVPNQYWAFVPNPNYDGHKATLKELVYQYETSDASIFTALKSGIVNVAYLPFSLYDSRTQLTGDVFSHVWVLGFTGIGLNETTNAPQVGGLFKQQYVRAALEMGIDQPAIVQAFYHGFAVPDYGPVPSQPGTIFYYRNLPAPYKYDPAAGKKLLEAHGWRMKDGVMTKGSQALRFTLIYPSGDQTEQSIVELIKATWAQEGVQVTLQDMQKNQIFALSPGAKNWVAAWSGNGWTYEPDYYPTGGELFKTGAGSNSTGYTNPTMDKLIVDTYLPGTPAQISARMQAYQRFAIEQLPELWMPHYALLTEHATYIRGTNSWFNSVTYYNYPNHWTISP